MGVFSKAIAIDTIDRIAATIHETAVAKGWWTLPRSPLDLLCLIHAEVSEACEAIRKHNPPSEHIPGFSSVEEELADVVIRVLDMAAANQWRVAEAILAKMAFNQTRPDRHGGKAF